MQLLTVASWMFQEEEVQQVQVQLAGSKQQLNLVQEKLSSGGASQPQAPYPSGVNSNSHAQPAATGQEYEQDHEYQNAEAYPGHQDADMEFEPPGSAHGADRDPSFDPSGMATPGAVSDARQEVPGSEGQDQGQGDLYSPGLSAQPSGMYMSEPSVHGTFPCRYSLPPTVENQQPHASWPIPNCSEIVFLHSLAVCNGRLCLDFVPANFGWLLKYLAG